MTEIETEIVPPGLPEEEDGEPMLGVWCSMNEGDGTHRSGSIMMNPEATDEQIAEAMIRTLIAAASMRSPGLADAVRKRVMV